MIRVIVVCLILPYILGMATCGPYLEQRDLVNLSVTRALEQRVVEDDAAVDTLAYELKQLFMSNGFYHISTGNSYGLSPWTGHTNNMHFGLKANNNVKAYTSVSKALLSLQIVELEKEVESGLFNTTKENMTEVLALKSKIMKYLKEKHKGLSYMENNNGTKK